MLPSHQQGVNTVIPTASMFASKQRFPPLALRIRCVVLYTCNYEFRWAGTRMPCPVDRCPHWSALLIIPSFCLPNAQYFDLQGHSSGWFEATQIAACKCFTLDNSEISQACQAYDLFGTSLVKCSPVEPATKDSCQAHCRDAYTAAGWSVRPDPCG